MVASLIFGVIIGFLAGIAACFGVIVWACRKIVIP